jgi:phosphotransferase system HPr-like phosphotransfer protein
VSLNTSGYVANFASVGVGSGIAVTVSGLTLSGAGIANYALIQPASLTANITAAGVTINSGITANSKPCDRTTIATLSFNNVVLLGVITGDTVSLNTSGYVANFASAGVGSGIAVTVSGLTLSGASSGNYTLTQPASLTANITAAGVTISSGITANSKAYDRTTTATLSSNNVVLLGVVNGDTVSLNTSGYVANFASVGVGSGIAVTVSGLALSGASAGNYTLTQPASLTANITAAPVTISSGITANNKVYDGTTTATLSSNNVVLSGVVPGDTVSLNTNGYVADFASEGVGNGIAVIVSGLSLTGTATNNYTLAQPASLVANITSPSVQILASMPNIVVSWTTNATEYVLMQTGNLTPPVTWSPVTNGITVNGPNNTVLIDASSGIQYFELIAAP